MDSQSFDSLSFCEWFPIIAKNLVFAQRISVVITGPIKAQHMFLIHSNSLCWMNIIISWKVVGRGGTKNFLF